MTAAILALLDSEFPARQVIIKNLQGAGVVWIIIIVHWISCTCGYFLQRAILALIAASRN
jgi:hypothetical protein